MNNAVDINHVEFSYGKKFVFSSLTLPVYENEITYIMGNNGCGKTTLLKLILGLIHPYSGSINILKKNINSYNSKELAKCIAYVPQAINQDIDFLVKDYLTLGRTSHVKFGNCPSLQDYEIVEKYSDIMGVSTYYETNFNQLSGGQKQLVCITRALIQETPIIVLDEPMSALDLGKQAELLLVLQKLKTEFSKTIILSSHNPNHAMQGICNVCFLHNGQILSYGKNTDVINEKIVGIIYGSYVEFCKKAKNVHFRMT